MWDAIAEADNDLILTKDSNIRLGPGDLGELVRHMAPGVGLVSAISVATQPQSLPAWIDAAIVNCYHGRILMLADTVGLGFGLGKVMLFRASDLARAGGLEHVAWALGEDAALSHALNRIGLRTVLARHVAYRALGRSSFSEIWERHLRWMLIWRLQVPKAFIGAFLGSAIPTALAGGLAGRLFGLSPALVVSATLGSWFVIESAICVIKGWPISFWSPIAFVSREIFLLLVWLRAWTTNRVGWSGTMHRAHSARVSTLGAPAPHRACQLD
jgi:ceramide glucosyltransferase